MENIETLNQRLIDHYGKYLDGRPMFRIMFSEDVMEKRLVTHTKDGFQLLTTQIAEVPKYRQYIHGKYILEGLKESQRLEKDGIVNEIAYECMWVFEDGNGNAVPPIWIGIEHILESVRCAMEGKSPKWVDPKEAENDPKTAYEAREKKLKDIQDALFPNETDVGDALAYKEAIVVPRNYTKEN
jgi:hypothetical protein